MRLFLIGLLGLVLAGCASAPAPTAATATVTGNVLYLDRTALPRPGALLITLQDVSRADAPAIILARQEIDIIDDSAPPFPFTLVYEPARLDPRGRYVVRAEIRDAGGDLRFTTTESYPVITQGAPRVIDVTVHPPGGPPNAGAPPPAPEPAAPSGGHNAAELRARGIVFRAVGNEPGWLLDLTASAAELSYDYGNNTAQAPLPQPTYPVEGHTRYDIRTGAHAISILIQRAPCQDVMSGEMFPARVTVTIDGRTLDGCGRST